jgi:ABC-type branched-subunit amino acid transport system substrate-binding protein
LVAVILVADGFLSAPLAAPLSAQEQRGKQIYLEGSSPGGESIFAFVGRTSTKVPASVLSCGSCHGYDGVGRPEGGVEPSNITWTNLIKSYGHHHTDGRRHPAFNEETVAAAIMSGRDPANNTLDSAMPRYSMSEEDLTALVAYLKHLETDLDPGLTETTISVASVLPSEGPYEALGQAAHEVLAAYFDEMNAQGGIYGRTIELQVVNYASTAESPVNQLRRLVETDRVFAVVGAFSVGIEEELFRLLEDNQVPMVGPVTLFAGHSQFRNDATFHVLSGLPDQARALLDHAALNLRISSSAPAVIIAEDDTYDGIARAIIGQAESRDWPAPQVVRFSGSPIEAVNHVTELKGRGTDTVFYFGPSRGLAAFAAEAVKADWAPRILLSGMLSGRAAFELPRAFDGRAFLAYPTLSSDRTQSGAEAFQVLHNKHVLPQHSWATQGSAYVAAKVFVEGLRRAGRALSRANLLAALEAFSDFETGLTPPVSFGPNRRVGALGAHVVSIDLATRGLHPGAEWIELD